MLVSSTTFLQAFLTESSADKASQQDLYSFSLDILVVHVAYRLLSTAEFLAVFLLEDVPLVVELELFEVEEAVWHLQLNEIFLPHKSQATKSPKPTSITDRMIIISFSRGSFFFGGATAVTSSACCTPGSCSVLSSGFLLRSKMIFMRAFPSFN